MSAFVVDKAHIDAMIQAGIEFRLYGSDLSWYHEDQRHELTLANADAVGAMLWGENARSVGYRYSYDGRVGYYGPEGAAELEADHGEDLPGRYVDVEVAPGVTIDMPEWAEPYAYKRYGNALKPVVVLKAIDCYEYQSCEHDEWAESEAHAFCHALRKRMIHSLPGYEDAPWGL